MTEHTDAQLAAAARSYLAARERLAGADGSDLLPAHVNVDWAYHQLHQAAGVTVEDCHCCEFGCDDDVTDSPIVDHDGRPVRDVPLPGE